MTINANSPPRFGNNIRSLLRSVTVIVERLGSPKWRALASELKDTQDELLACKERLTDTQRLGNMGIWDWIVPTHELIWSDQIYSIFGFQPHEFEARFETFLDRVHPDDRSFVNSALQTAVISGRPYAVKYRIIQPTGTVRQIYDQGKTTLRSSGKALRMSGTLRDITDLVTVENQLEETHASLSGILSITQEAIILANDDLKIVHFSRGAQEIFGYGEDQALGMHVEELIPEQLRLAHRDYVQSFRDNPVCSIDMGARQELVGLRKNGDKFPAAISLSKYPGKNGNLYSIVLRDVGPEKAAHDALVTAKRNAQAADRAKSEFLANMSHEIRTPMNGVLGMTDVLLRTNLCEQQQEYVRTIQESGKALLDLLNNILDLSKIEAGRIDIEKSCFSIQELLSSTSALWSHYALEKGLSFSAINNATDTDVIKSDQFRLRQVVNNLIGNAVKFTEKGTVEVTSKIIRHSDTTAELRIEVRDTGIGLSDEQSKELFTPFSQADASTTRKYGGSGLGLSICKNLVELLDGEIGVVSSPGTGSTFWFNVPIELGPPVNGKEHDLTGQEIDETTITSDVVQRPLHILVAEDSHINRQVISCMLAPLNARVDIVENGLEAVAAVTRSPYDVVLMDIQMPQMNGIEATREIRRLVGARGELPIIALTASAMIGDRQTYIDSDLTDFVAKPIDQNELFGAISRCTHRSTPKVEVTSLETDVLNVAQDENTKEELNSLMSSLDNLFDSTES